MRVIQVTATADADGAIRLTIPVGAGGGDYDLAVVLNPRSAVNGSNTAKSPEELGWPPGFFENVIGSIDDDMFMRHPQGEFEKRETLD